MSTGFMHISNFYSYLRRSSCSKNKFSFNFRKFYCKKHKIMLQLDVKKIRSTKMKQLEKFFSHASMYTVFISMAFYLFSEMVNTTGLSMTFARFFTIFAFSMIISSMEYIFTVAKIPKGLQFVIHYVTLCAAFTIVFFTVRKTSSDFLFSPSTIFAAIVLFSFGYGLFFLALYFIRKLTSDVKKNSEKNENQAPSYTSRFK